MRVLGFMTGTSLDAVDMAVLETDGTAILGFGPAGERKLGSETRRLVEAATLAALAWGWGEPEPSIFKAAARAIADEHIVAARSFLAEHDIVAADLDLIGFHGQTVLHQPVNDLRYVGRTVQLGDAQRVADALGLPVAYDFRGSDVAAGGQGAPLAPVYHQALARWSGLDLPVAVLNLGGVGNVTLIGGGSLRAFDTGPANGMIDLLVQARTGARCDVDGALARAGAVDRAILAAYLDQPYFRRSGAKSLDRYDFSIDSVGGLSLEDAAATLTAFAAEAVAIGLRACATRPRQVIACGGGRRNPVLMAQISTRCGVPVVPAEAIDWRGDAVEAEAFAYLAARTARGAPISFPETTGVATPMTGGRIAEPHGSAGPLPCS